MTRILSAIGIPLGLIVLAFASFFVVLFGRPERRSETASAMSRVLGALWDGNGRVTFSAWSWRMLLLNKKWGPFRVKLVDCLNGENGHCKKWWEWHQQHGLFDEN